ncbi:hypothetical protein JB92DRAFT_2892604 [Gautieria morchelliformis]|nr:hypothetical protein JB92DRAFT_2892604 [Gautieria morchelliformis]
MQAVLQYLLTFILASLPPAPPSALHGARPHSSSSPPRSSPGCGEPSIARSHSKTSGCAAGHTHIPTPCAWRSSSPCSSTTSLHTPCSAQSSMIMLMQHLYATSLLPKGEIEIRSKILIIGWGFRRRIWHPVATQYQFPIASQHP